MSLRIDEDHNRFKQIVRGRIRKNLRQYISQGELIGKQGKDVVSIPIPQIDIPRFRYGDKQQGGVGQGDGDEGDPVGGDPQEGDGKGQAGKDGGQHVLEVDVTLDELAEILGEELALPNIENRGKSKVIDQKDRYVGVRRVGPNSLRHFKRTYKAALRRQIVMGRYDPSNPIVIPTRDDMRYRSWKTEEEPVANAVIIYMMDVSGSMGDEQKEIVRIESFWIDAWLQRQYKGVETRFIIHDAVAREVDRDTFFRTRESGGTMISSAYKLAAQMIDSDYPPAEWNIYPFHFSDGDNWSVDDTLVCIDLMKKTLLPASNVFCYGQVESPYGSGQFIKDLREHLKDDERIITSEIRDRDAIVGSIRDFLGKESDLSAYKLTRRLPRYLRDIQLQVEEVARSYGLDFFPTMFEVVAYDQMNELAAYGGFPVRYPHWRFGMEYEQLSKSSEYGLSKIYEMVINNSPAIAYLLEGNSIVDQKLVMAHVTGHVDFFKNNFAFRATDQGTDRRTGEPIRKWIDTMANHGAIVRRWADRVGIERVEEFIDSCLSLENLIDPQKPFVPQKREKSEEEEGDPLELALLRVDREYMESYINPQEFVDEQREKAEAERERAKRTPEHPDRDVLGFLLDHAPLERWERDILAVVRREAYYFWPQMQTKIMNEGWACVDPSTLVFTDAGLVPMRDVVEGRAGVVSDGEAPRRVYDQHVIEDHETVTIRTRRGLTLTGSNNHRIMLPDGSWARLDAIAVGDSIRVSGGADLWPSETLPIAWDPPRRISLDDAAAEAEVSVWTVLRHRAGAPTQRAEAVARALEPYEAPENQRLPQALDKRRAIRVPTRLDAELGAFLGYLVGDGHISKKKRQLGLTTGDEAQADRFAQLLVSLFDVRPSTKLDGGRWRVLAHAEMLSDFLVETFGLTTGPSAREKQIPDAVLRSPEPVVRAFLTACFDCDGYAGRQGVILSSVSEALITQTQLLLLNYGILSRARSQTDGTFHLHVTGASAKRFEERVGFGLERKREALAEYLSARKHFERERWEDSVVSVEHGRGEVWDISVEETHRYAAAGFVNHNSYWHSRLMTEKLSDDSEIIEYAERNAGVMETGSGRLNPYKLGVELYRHIEERWDRGQFGKEWEDCESLEARQSWDRRTGLGRQKIFEVRKLYNDVTFIDEFLTPEFVAAQKLYSFGYNQRNDRYEIESRQFREVKQKLLFALTNAGQPFIHVVDINHENRGELLLSHDHQGVDLRIDWAKEVLRALVRVWRRPVEIHTLVDNKPTLLRFDGKEHVQRPLK